MSKSPISYDATEREQLASALASHTTISATIRALADFGWPRARIADSLGKSYQHVRNVLVAAEKHMIDVEGSLKAGNVSLSDIPEKAKQAHTAIEGLNFQYLQDALANAPQALKKPVNLTINSSLLEAARHLNLNLSETLERELTAILLQQARERWQVENSEAIEAHNQFVERHGLWSDGLRQF